MIISYNWLCEYLPEKTEPEKLSRILTAIGLEVESMEKLEEIKGGLTGLVIGEVISCEAHPDADKLKITRVNTGTPQPLQIVCGAPNVAAGQKVVVATIGATIYPVTGEPLPIKKAKIRGVESHGMICAEDEIGLGTSHDGILILPNDLKAGTPASEYFLPGEDHIFGINLTPNRIDAMSHLGVAKDVCAWLSHHNKSDTTVKSPFKSNFKVDHQGLQMEVIIENKEACQRYAGVSIQGVTIAESPKWLKERLTAIGLKTINNIVDITNFILHETGQPLHAFDADMIKGKKLVIKNLPEGSPFVTLDDKERKISATDLMICNAEEAMCIAGVYGGLHSGVTGATKNIFLESAWFNPVSIRKTSLRLGLRTDAATRFEKGVDISNTVNVLKRAVMLIKEIAGGEIASDLVDAYPVPKEKKEVSLKYHYLKKLSGKNYHADAIKNILNHLGFELIKEGADEMRFTIPLSKPDVSIAAEVVEEIMRIDGLDNIDIPALITMAPAVETLAHEEARKEKAAALLTGAGFNEIFTNSITNSTYYGEDLLHSAVKMANNLSKELNIMRPSMLETGLERVAYNLNRKNNDIRFFEFGKTYRVNENGKYIEKDHLAIHTSGKKYGDGWKQKGEKTDIFFLKAIVENIIEGMGLKITTYLEENQKNGLAILLAKIKNEAVASLVVVDDKMLDRFDIKQPVFYDDLDWEKLLQLSKKYQIVYAGIPKYPAVQRDLSIVLDKTVNYETVENATYNAKINKLKNISLFDIFESDKLGTGKKSMAVSFTFLDEEKTLTDKEIDSMMNKIISTYEKELNAEVRK